MSTKSAAKRVLTQAKLLENILLHLCDCDTVRGIPLKAPVTKLYVVQRVNTSFQATIQGSIALARLMWLYPPEKKTDEEVCASEDLQDLYLGPLEWLFEIIGNPITTRDPKRYTSSLAAFAGGIETCLRPSWRPRAGQGLMKCSKRGFMNEGASWGDMVAFHVVPEEKVDIIYDVSEYVQVGLGTNGRRNLIEYKKMFYDEEFEIDEDDTLGVVWDRWVDGTDENTDRQAEVIRQYVLERDGRGFVAY